MMVWWDRLWFRFLLFAAAYRSANCHDSYQAPVFIQEPPYKVSFSNSSGTIIQCTADGIPKPTVSWIRRNGAPVSDIPSIRQIRSDGSLLFFPFRAEDYRQDVHATVYKCIASNLVGAIASRDVHVRGDVRQPYTPQVYDEFVVLGNTAVLRCHVPTFVRDHVVVVKWLRDDGHTISASDGKEGEYTLLRTGELYIHKVGLTDSGRTFKCQTMDRLQGDLTLSSSAGQLIVTASPGPSPPRITFYHPQVHAQEGSSAQLVCGAEGQPSPNYRWFREEFGQIIMVKEDQRIWFKGGIMTIKNVMATDSRKYYCFATNTAGEEKVEIKLAVSAPLSVTVNPPLQVLDVGSQTTLNCTVKGYPVHSIVWMKNLQHLVPNTRIRMLSRDLLHITSVQREDKGIYQCFAFNENDSAQGTSELSLGDSAPVLLSTFSESVLRPGDRLSLSCLVSGSPLPHIRWSIDDHRVTSNLRMSVGDYVTPQGEVHSHLNISSVRIEDGGEYRCEGANEIGHVSHVATVSVHGPPFVRTMKNVSVVSGRTLVLRCPVGGYPIDRITWKKGGIVLPLNSRQKIDASWKLVVENVQPGADEGEYVCEASNAAHQTASGQTYVKVIVAPVIDELFFPTAISAEEGARARMMCSATIGDPPLQLKWLKDGKPLTPHGEMTVQTSEDSSTISFRKVMASDRGEYTCVVSNTGASVNKSLHLTVNVPPRWKVAPVNSSAILGSKVSLDCEADGFPTPTITWSKAKESVPADFSLIYSNSRSQILNNGTLVLEDVERNDEGYFLCQAQNGVGGGISKVFFLKVFTPPTFDTKYKSVAVTKNDNAILECHVTGEQPIKTRWMKNKQELEFGSSRKRLSVDEIRNEDEVKFVLSISSATRQDSGIYSCEASNKYGKDESNIQLLVQEVPEPPINVTVTNKTSRSATIQWFPSFDGNSAISRYIIQYQKTQETDDQKIGQLLLTRSETTAVIRDLHPVTSYKAWVVAENGVGQSARSVVVNFTTDEEAPGGPPRDIKVQSTGSQSLKVTWKPPNKELRYGKIAGYYVGYKTTVAGDQYQYKHIERGGEDDESVISTYLTNLHRLTQYSVVVQAYNSAGPGPRSDEVLATTLETAPPTSPIVTVASTSTTSVHLRWERDHKDKSTVTEYLLHYKHEGGSWQEQPLTAEKNSYVLEGLRCGTTYRIFMTSKNSLGTGEPSETVTVRTNGAAPVSPSISNFISPNTTFARLNLNAWQSGGCPILYFKISYRHKFQRQWVPVSDKVSPQQNVVDVLHLSPGREYNLLVTAHSDAGVTQAEYDFQTLQAVTTVSPALPTSLWSSSDTSGIPFHKNFTLLLPICISVAVIFIVVVALIVCLRQHIQDVSSRGSSDTQSRKRGMSDNYNLSELSQKLKMDSTDQASFHQACRITHEYSEPYTAMPAPRRLENSVSDDRASTEPPRSFSGSFATIKRIPFRPGCRTAGCAQGQETPTSHQVILPERSEYSSLSSHSEGSNDKGSSQSGGSRKLLR